jgi:hypothetical protein
MLYKDPAKIGFSKSSTFVAFVLQATKNISFILNIPKIKRNGVVAIF